MEPPDNAFDTPKNASRMRGNAFQSWWVRNWKWAVPVGCFGTVAFFVALGATIVMVVATAMTSSWAYTNAIELAESNQEVRAALGAPLEAGWFINGSMSVTGPSGEAELSIPMKGPRGWGTLYVIAEKRAGKWVFELVELEVAGLEKRIDLLAASGGQGSARNVAATRCLQGACAKRVGVESEVTEVDGSCVFCEFVVPHDDG